MPSAVAEAFLLWGILTESLSPSSISSCILRPDARSPWQSATQRVRSAGQAMDKLHSLTGRDTWRERGTRKHKARTVHAVAYVAALHQVAPQKERGLPCSVDGELGFDGGKEGVGAEGLAHVVAGGEEEGCVALEKMT